MKILKGASWIIQLLRPGRCEKKRMCLYLFAKNNRRDHIYEFIYGIYKGDYLFRNLNYLSNTDEIVAHPRGFEPLAS